MTTTTGRYSRFFYRCTDCLTTVVTETELKEQPLDPKKTGYYDVKLFATCGCCGGMVQEYLGACRGDYSRILVKQQWQCPCDGRCTGALGPSCDCECGGKNHGSNLVVAVEIDGRGIPRVLAPSNGAEKAVEYRAKIAEIENAWDEKYGYVCNLSGWIDPDLFAIKCKGVTFRKKIGKVKGMQVHKTRMKKLNELLQELKGKAATV